MIGQRWRGDRVESIHRGCWVVVDTAGAAIAAAGDPEQYVFARSSSKSLQALAFAESGAIDEFGVTQPETAITLASHSGEPLHLATVTSLLAKVGLDPSALQCGQARSRFAGLDQVPTRLRHNCSGKHAGFLAASTALSADPSEYLHPDHVVQQRARRAVEEMCDLRSDELVAAVDGCGAPTFCLPLVRLATGIARVANPAALGATKATACTVLTDAAAAHPQMIGGADPVQFDTAVAAATNGRLFAKSGADGVQVIGVRGADVAFAGKVDDGSFRALWPLAIEVLGRLGLLPEAEAQALGQWTERAVHNAAGREVGRHEVTEYESIRPIIS